MRSARAWSGRRTQTDNYATSASTTDDEQTTYTYTSPRAPRHQDPEQAAERQLGAGAEEHRHLLRQRPREGRVELRRDNPDQRPARAAHAQLHHQQVYQNGNKVSDVFKNPGAPSTVSLPHLNLHRQLDLRRPRPAHPRSQRHRPNHHLHPRRQPASARRRAAATSPPRHTGSRPSPAPSTGSNWPRSSPGLTNNRYLYDSAGNLDCVIKSTLGPSQMPRPAHNAPHRRTATTTRTASTPSAPTTAPAPSPTPSTTSTPARPTSAQKPKLPPARQPQPQPSPTKATAARLAKDSPTGRTAPPPERTPTTRSASAQR